MSALYLVVGLGCAVVVLSQRRDGAAWTDAALLLVCWPLHGPFLWSRPVVVPLGAARLPHITGPLAALVPDEAVARRLTAQMQAAAQRAEEIDRLLAQPDFNPAQTRARAEQLRQMGREAAAAHAERSAEHLDRLRAMGDRYHAELDEVVELMQQLRTQAEIMRLAGGGTAPLRPLVTELVDRVTGLDAVLSDDLLVPDLCRQSDFGGFPKPNIDAKTPLMPRSAHMGQDG